MATSVMVCPSCVCVCGVCSLTNRIVLYGGQRLLRTGKTVFRVVHIHGGTWSKLVDWGVCPLPGSQQSHLWNRC